MELEMAFDDEDDSASVDMDGEEGEEWKKLALGTGSGGVKGRRAGMVFKCENCGKVSLELIDRGHLTLTQCRNTDIPVVLSSIDGSIVLIGKSLLLFQCQSTSRSRC
jgi:hypothetical protein